MSFFVYMLECADGSIYTGQTENFDVRFAQHACGHFPRCYTFKRRPLTVLWLDAMGTRIEALAAERQVKGWTRAKKLALATGDWSLLAQLAQPRRSSLVERPSTRAQD